MIVVPEGNSYFVAGDPDTLASAAKAIKEHTTATAAIKPVPWSLPHSVPPQLQPFLCPAPPSRILKLDHFVYPNKSYTPPSEPRPPSSPTLRRSHPGAHLIPGFCSCPPYVPCALSPWFKRARPLPQRSTYCVQPPLFSPRRYGSDGPTRDRCGQLPAANRP